MEKSFDSEGGKFRQYAKYAKGEVPKKGGGEGGTGGRTVAAKTDRQRSLEKNFPGSRPEGEVRSQGRQVTTVRGGGKGGGSQDQQCRLTLGKKAEREKHSP